MSLPTINTFSLDEQSIELFWKASPKSDIRKWNLYASSEVLIDFTPPNKGVVLPGTFVKVIDGISNIDTPVTPGSVYIKVARSLLSVASHDPCYFLITSVDKNGLESAMDVHNIHAVPWADDYYVDEAGQPVNVVYKNFEFDLWPSSGWDPDRCLDILSLLGRTAKEIKVDVVGANVWIKLNSMGNDPISIRESLEHDFYLIRGEMLVDKIYVNNPTTNDATMRIFVAG